MEMASLTVPRLAYTHGDVKISRTLFRIPSKPRLMRPGNKAWTGGQTKTNGRRRQRQ